MLEGLETKYTSLIGILAMLELRTCLFQTEWHEAKPRTSLAADLSDRRHFALFVVFDLTLLASFPFKTSRIRWSLLVLLGNGTLGRRVAPLSVQYTLS